MPISVEKYTPQSLLLIQKRQAVWVWSVAMAVAFIWLAMIILAPLLEASGVKSISQPVYGFFSHLCHQISSRSFHYHEYPFAVCARCFGFYAGFWLGVVIYPFFRALNNTDSFSRVWLFAAMVPMGIDFSLTFFEIWENTHVSRSLTGLILGIACALFMIPALVEISYFARQSFKKK